MSDILQAVQTTCFCAGLVAGVLASPKLYGLLVAWLGKKNADWLVSIAGPFVRQAEQTMKGKDGSEKFSYVFDAVNGALASKNRKFDKQFVIAAIESEVFNLPKLLSSVLVDATPITVTPVPAPAATTTTVTTTSTDQPDVNVAVIPEGTQQGV